MRPLLDAREKHAATAEILQGFDYKEYITRTHAEQDRAGRLLVWLANPQKRGVTIVEITNKRRKRVYRQMEINDVFANYYEQLYEAPALTEELRVKEYLRSIDLNYL